MEEPKRLRTADCAAALRIPRIEVWLRHRFGQFALPAGTDEYGPFWYEERLYRWAAASESRRLVLAAPLRCWPTANEPAGYSGVQKVQGCAVQVWSTFTGTIGVVWPLPEHWHPGAEGTLPTS